MIDFFASSSLPSVLLLESGPLRKQRKRTLKKKTNKTRKAKPVMKNTIKNTPKTSKISPKLAKVLLASAAIASIAVPWTKAIILGGIHMNHNETIVGS